MSRRHMHPGFLTYIATALIVVQLRNVSCQNDSDRNIIETNGQNILKIYETDDPTQYINEYMYPETVILPPGKPAVKGKAALLKMIAGMGTVRNLVTDSLEINGNIAIQTHHFQLADKNNTVLLNGKGIRVWKKTWKLQYSVWNYNN